MSYKNRFLVNHCTRAALALVVGIILISFQTLASKDETKDPRKDPGEECSKMVTSVSPNSANPGILNIPEIDIFHNISEEMIGTIPPNKSLQILLNALVKNVGAQSAAIVLLELNTGSPIITVSVGLDPEISRLYETLIVHSDFSAKVSASENMVYVAENEEFPIENVKSLLGMRLVTREKNLGAIYMTFRENQHHFSEAQKKHLEIIAKRLAPLLDNQRLYEEAKRSQTNLLTNIQELKNEAVVRDQFVTLVTHDLRGPISAALLSASLLLRKLTDLESQKLVTKIINPLSRLNTMVDDLLDASRIKAGQPLKQEVEYCDDLEAIVKSALEDIETVHGKRFEVSSDAKVSGYWSTIGIRRIIQNLASNAIKYGDPELPITIVISQEKRGVEISVKNFGDPLTKGEIASLSKIYRQVKRNLSKGFSSWGIGLTIVRGLIDAHGGELLIESTKSKGTIFTVKLPYDSRTFQNGT
ncbi:MAG: ATP-binding protein [Bacteriovoracia bacterium]